MQQGIDAMTVALRVLTAMTKGKTPEPTDVEELKRLAPLLADQPLDELCCDIIQQAVKRRDLLRKAL